MLFNRQFDARRAIWIGGAFCNLFDQKYEVIYCSPAQDVRGNSREVGKPSVLCNHADEQISC
jgi:hypothetical protein